MKKFWIFFISFVLLIFIPTIVSAEGNIFGDEKKLTGASINTKNEKSNTELSLLFEVEGEKRQGRIYLDIDLSDIPSDATIIDGFLTMRLGQCIGDSIDVNVARVLTDWEASKLIWADKPGFSSPSVNVRVDCTNQKIQWNISTIVKYLFEHQNENFGIVVIGPDETGNQPYSLSFDATAAESRILIDYEKSSTPTTLPTGGPTGVDKKVYLVGIGIILVVIVIVIAVLIYQMIGKKNKSKKDNNEENNDKIGQIGVAKSLNLNEQTPEEKNE